MTGPTLFDIDPTVGHARNTDPSTSHDAAAQANVRPQALQVLRYLIRQSRLSRGGTVAEVQDFLRADGIDIERNIIARRLDDLQAAGLADVIIDNGGPLVRMGNAGRFMRVWAATDVGKAVAKR